MALLKSTKEDVQDWLNRNGAEFGLVTENKMFEDENHVLKNLKRLLRTAISQWMALTHSTK